jgi:hypothetical protein
MLRKSKKIVICNDLHKVQRKRIINNNIPKYKIKNKRKINYKNYNI